MGDKLQAVIAEMHEGGILLSEATREFRKRFIRKVLEANRGNQCKAARELGMHRNTLSRTMAELNLDAREITGQERRPPRRSSVGIPDVRKQA